MTRWGGVVVRGGLSGSKMANGGVYVEASDRELSPASFVAPSAGGELVESDVMAVAIIVRRVFRERTRFGGARAVGDGR
jgi:hypothetical protein